MPDNKRKTGARTPRPSASSENTGISRDASTSKPPKDIGNSEPAGVRPSKPSGDARKDSGAGPALARHAKDAKGGGRAGH